MNKYRAHKVTYDGVTFDSRLEHRRWCELQLLERAGEISDLQRQVHFELIPAVRGKGGKIEERPVVYIADFVYKDHDGNQIVEDAKGAKTREYIIKRKLMRFVHGIKIREVER
jgi:hypothetical protein